jgi:UPF0755 protein
MTKNKKIIIGIAGGIVVMVIGIGVFAFQHQFAAPQKGAETERIVVNLTTTEAELIPILKEQGYIRSEWAFNYVLKKKGWQDKIQSGGYKISKGMNAWELAEVLTSEPYMKWVVIPEGLRKEQIAELLAEELGWSDQQKSDWVIKFTAMKYDYVEGVYFPDTYLIPKDEEPLQVADRLRAKFNEKFQPYTDKFLKANIKWTTALKIASIVQREAAGKDDMPLIAGILWNRLLKDMKLEVDATVQYARDDKIHFKGDPCQDPESTARKEGFCFNPELLQPTATYISEGDWWKPITLADKQIDSLYNTYLYKGLPPHPIDNPGLDAIDAVLNSTETECLYYLHDSSGQIHCSKTYEEHQANVEQYLKGEISSEGQASESWELIKQAINNCEAESVWQTHDRAVMAKLKTGEELNGVEPKIDDIINIAETAESKCGKILMGTE